MDQNKLNRQRQQLLKGPKHLHVLGPATLGNGILQWTATEIHQEGDSSHDYFSSRQWAKFIPASGMATRLFSALLHFLDAAEKPGFDFQTYLDHPNHKAFHHFYTHWTLFPFCSSSIEQQKSASTDDFVNQLKALMFTPHTGMMNQPKALLPLFKDKNQQLISLFELHIMEALALFESQQTVALHFTVDQDHLKQFQVKEKALRDHLTQNVQKRLKIAYSFQDPATDTIALTPEGEVFYDRQNTLLRRKAGHGALLENLHRIEEDIFIVQNIDNLPIAAADQSTETHRLMRLFAFLHQKITHILSQLKADAVDYSTEEIASFLEKYFFKAPNKHLSSTAMRDEWIHFLDRPLRVCGMIKNQGKPGGGPFWVRTAQRQTLQIVEQSQLQKNDKAHAEALAKATHFNPVHMVCARKDYAGNPWNYHAFSDPEMFMVVDKLHEGQPLKALELPGLWNGGMAHWNTVFVEISQSAFNSIKSINDCLPSQD